MPGYRIGTVVQQTGLSADTLRYYERIGLLPSVQRTHGGTRVYDERDLSRLRFNQRAQGMGFALHDIGTLLRLRDDATHAHAEARKLAKQKLHEVNERLAELTVLRNELELLLDACQGADSGSCPIIAGLEHDEPAAAPTHRPGGSGNAG